MSTRRLVQDRQAGAIKGVNFTASPAFVGNNQLRRAEEVRLSEAGAFGRRLGTRRIHEVTLGGAIRGGFGWKRTTGTLELIAAGGTVYQGSYGVPATLNAMAGAIDPNAIPSFAVFRDAVGEKCYIADGGLLNKTDGVSVTVNIAGTPAAVARIAAVNNRLYGVTGVDDTLYYGQLGDGDTLGNVGAGGGFQAIRTYGGQRIINIKPIGASLLLFHQSAVSVWTGTSIDDINLLAGTRGLSEVEGLVAANAIVVIDKEVSPLGTDSSMAMFLTPHGLWGATENAVFPVSREIEDLLLTLDQSSWASVSAAHHRRYGEVVFFLPGFGCLVFNYRTRSWSGPWKGGYLAWDTTAMWSTNDGANRAVMLVGGADGFVRRACYPGAGLDDILSDGSAGSRFTMVAQLHRMFFKTPHHTKAYKKAFVMAGLDGSDQAGLHWRTPEGQDSWTFPVVSSVVPIWNNVTWNQFTWAAPDQQTVIHEVDLSELGEYVDFTIVDAGLGESRYELIDADAYLLIQRR